MLFEPSNLARQIAGTFIRDQAALSSSLVEWIQAECRTGQFSRVLAEAIAKYDATLRLDLALVEKVESEKITVRLPGVVSDHESTSTFRSDGVFELNPLTQAVTYLGLTT